MQSSAQIRLFHRSANWKVCTFSECATFTFHSQLHHFPPFSLLLRYFVDSTLNSTSSLTSSPCSSDAGMQCSTLYDTQSAAVVGKFSISLVAASLRSWSSFPQTLSRIFFREKSLHWTLLCGSIATRVLSTCAAACHSWTFSVSLDLHVNWMNFLFYGFQSFGYGICASVAAHFVIQFRWCVTSTRQCSIYANSDGQNGWTLSTLELNRKNVQSFIIQIHDVIRVGGDAAFNAWMIAEFNQRAASSHTTADP